MKTENEMLKYAIAKDVKLNLSFAAGIWYPFCTNVPVTCNATFYQCSVIKTPFSFLSAQAYFQGSGYYSASVPQMNLKFLPPSRSLQPTLWKQQPMLHSYLSQEVRRCLTLFPSKLFVFLSRALFLQGRISSGTASLSPASSQCWAEYWVQLPATTVWEVQERAPAHVQPLSFLGNIHLPWGTCLPSTGSLVTPGSLIL